LFKENLAGAKPLGEARLPSCPYASKKVLTFLLCKNMNLAG
jgi:hypothetical protein